MKNANRCFSVFVLIFVSLASSIHLFFAANYIPSEQILLNCGESSILNDSDTRSWTPDVGSKFLLSAKSLTSKATTQDPLVPKVPYMTARLSHFEFSYRFPVVPGRMLVRLHFYLNSYNGHNATDAVFSVTAYNRLNITNDRFFLLPASFTLLRNFSIAQTTEALSYAYIIKEYLIAVDGETLTIKFTPSTNSSNAYAFVNGIEVISVPDIYYNDIGLKLVGQDSLIFVDNNTALENVYRINVGGNDISPSGDTGLFRYWYNDQPYLYGETVGVTVTADPSKTLISYPKDMPTYVAPKNVYSTARSMGPNPQINKNYNLTWIFSVDVGFYYLVRLHFCEVQAAINQINQRKFNIFLGNGTAESGVDVIRWVKHTGVPVYKDYVVIVGGEGPQQDLWLALHPNLSEQPQYYDAILNGVEIFKLSDTDYNLAGANPISAPKQDVVDPSKALPSTHAGKSNKQKAIIGGLVGGGLVALAAIGFCVFAVNWHGKDHSPSDEPTGQLPNTNTTGSYASSLPSNLCRHFSFSEMEAATKNFDEALLLGVGGFGKVYEGEIDGGMKVAIKRGNLLYGQGVHEFQTEIETLSKLRHCHLVSLIGYCEENSEMILVYDYMAHGTLRGHLYNAQKPPLPWKQRLEICIGAARGLHYLHTGSKHPIIHRDVKSTNILLDEKWVAKVSDFGLSKTGPTLDQTDHLTASVKGSFGYLDPEYVRRQQLTMKSDVYSFGVVLFEVICARPALNTALAHEQMNLAEWAICCHQKGNLDKIIDPYLKGKIAPECFKKFVETALKCISDQSKERPSMGDVLWNLDCALQLQQSAEEGIGGKMDIQEGSSSMQNPVIP
ncbi:hypothetical protein LWI28_001933 [Acer negundo]|uniref:non-specific serine/threonine protein kinase n=1 Tax=Acer negundo TaxID=4023 RepID=A0AAD5I5B0_ACENE|nr:hypothetical protein LWI28_001933 [Acer negundo]